jgi:predicted nucleotidyltransferase
MDIFDEDLLSFWRTLNKRGVKYIMVGGVATNLNGYQRTTEDIDIWLEDTGTNREQFREAYREYSGTDLSEIATMQFIPGWVDFRLNNGFVLDILVDMKGLEGFGFEDCLRQANIADIEDVRIPFLHINHLIANKKAVNRPKDQLDVIYLEQINALGKDSSED